jgi:hypothetical protein
VLLGNIPESPSSSVSWSNSFDLQSDLKFTEYVLSRKIILSPRSFEIRTSFEVQALWSVLSINVVNNMIYLYAIGQASSLMDLCVQQTDISMWGTKEQSDSWPLNLSGLVMTNHAVNLITSSPFGSLDICGCCDICREWNALLWVTSRNMELHFTHKWSEGVSKQTVCQQKRRFNAVATKSAALRQDMSLNTTCFTFDPF